MWKHRPRGQRDTCGTGLLLVARLVPVGGAAVCVAGVAFELPFCVAGVTLMALGWLWWRAWFPLTPRGGRRGIRKHQLPFCVVGVAFGDLWRSWHLFHWAAFGGALGSHLFVWRAWHLEASTSILCGRRGSLRGRRGIWKHRFPFCVAGVAFGNIELHFVWQAWHLWHWAGSGGALGCRCVWRAWHLNFHSDSVWQTWHLWHWAGSGGVLGSRWRHGCLSGSCGIWKHRLPFCVAGMALTALGWLWWGAWFPQAWHLEASASILCRRLSWCNCLCRHSSFTQSLFHHLHATYIHFLTHNSLTHNLLTHTTLSHTTFTRSVFCHLHATCTYFFKYLTHNLLTQNSLTRFVFHHLLSLSCLPIPSSPFFLLLIGRSWHVGFSGPLIPESV